jgi:hypothetical protein
VPRDATSFGWATSVGDERGAAPASVLSPIDKPADTAGDSPAAPQVQPDASWGRLLFGIDLWDAAGNHDACLVESRFSPMTEAGSC